MRYATSLTLVALLAAAAAQGAVPSTISYQGVLRDAGGSPVPNGPWDLTFRLYDVDAGGTALWTEAQTVATEEGIFNVVLGSANPLSLPFDEPYWLGISVEADPELMPRVELTSAPYALRAAVADVGSDSDWAFTGSDIYRLSGRVGIGTPSPAYKLDVRDDVDGVTGIRIQNTDTGSQSREELRFDNEDGSLAGIFMYDDDHVYASAMAIANNRPGGHIRLSTAGAERVRISNSGGVGIGVPDPSEKLEVGGTAKVEGFAMDTGAAAGHVLTSDASGNGTWQAPAAVPDGDWVVQGTTVYTLVGDVGIAETNPSERLDVAGTAEVDGFRLTTGPTAGHVLTSDASGNGTWQAPAGGLTLPYAGSAASDPGGVFEIANTDLGPAIEGLNTHLYGNTRGYLADRYYGVLGEDLDTGNFAYLGSADYGIYAKSYTDQAIHGRHEPSGNYAALAGPDCGARVNGDVIVTNGDVGIGVDPPTTELDVDGEVLITSASSSGRALDIQKTYPSSAAQTVNIERTVAPSAGNDILQMTVPSGSGFGFQFIECDQGGGIQFAVDGDGHIESDGGATIHGFVDVAHDASAHAGRFTSAFPSATAEVLHVEYTGTGSYHGKAVYGKCAPVDHYGYGGYFEGGALGLYGFVSPTGSLDYYGVNGSASGGSGTNCGVRGYASSSGTNYGIFGYATGGATNYAGYFAGNARVTGTLSKGAGSFQIDHPLDPANKYLYHSFVESPDMMNIYNGNILLDAHGEAWIELPEWFEALNGDFRYQLTALGAPAPNLYVADEISGNRFRIAGGEPGMKVSWQVTGVRHDAFAEENRIPVEEMKSPEERGKYIHPTAFGLPETMSIDHSGAEPRPLESPQVHEEPKDERVRADDGA